MSILNDKNTTGGADMASRVNIIPVDALAANADRTSADTILN